MSLLDTLRKRSLEQLKKRSMLSLVRAACWAALLGLAIMCTSIFIPTAIPVIFAMSVGHAIGIVAFLCYLISVLMDLVRGAEHPPEVPGPARQFRADKTAPSDPG